MFTIARGRLAQEMSLIEVVKSRRYFNAALRLLLTDEERARLKKKTRYLVVS